MRHTSNGSCEHMEPAGFRSHVDIKENFLLRRHNFTHVREFLELLGISWRTYSPIKYHHLHLCHKLQPVVELNFLSQNQLRVPLINQSTQLS